MATTKRSFKTLLVIIALLGAGLRFTPPFTYVHEIGHVMAAQMTGGNAKILSPTSTSVSNPQSTYTFVRAGGHVGEVFLWSALMVWGGRGSKRRAFALGGMISTLFLAAPRSTDLSGHPGAWVWTIVFVVGFLALVRAIDKGRAKKSGGFRKMAFTATYPEGGYKSPLDRPPVGTVMMVPLTAFDPKYSRLAKKKRQDYTL